MFAIAVKKTIELTIKHTQIEHRRNSWSSRYYFLSSILLDQSKKRKTHCKP